MKTLIISNGSIKDYDFYKDKIHSNDLIICADGGARHAYNMGITPDVILGDFDSLENEYFEELKPKDVKVLNYPADKDETDTQLAVEYALKNGCTEVTLLGCLGTRFDHSFANISLLKLLSDNNVVGRILNEHNEIYLIDDHINLTGSLGDKVSLLPLTDTVSGITTKGLKYSLHDATMRFGMPNGVSNVFESEQAEIRITKGLLLVIKAWD